MKYQAEVRGGMSDECLVGTGIMTDEVAASSYGLPVFVSDRDHRSFGPGDWPMPECTINLLTPKGAQPGWNREIEDWLVKGGWHLSFAGPQ